ncbi:MAG: type II secretion system F family protein [Firmicutes bacterium]|nr:type II secretion system F family protein [Bacillota bacterium]
MAKQESGPQYYVSRIHTQVLNYDVYVMKKTEKFLYMLLLFAAGGAVGLIFYGGLFKEDGRATLMTTASNFVVFVFAGILAIKCFLPTITLSLKKKRAEKLKKQFCDFAAALTNALASGMNMTDALHAVYNDLQSQYSDAAYIVEEIQEIINGVHNNIPIEDMLEDFGTRSGIPDILNFATVFSTCYRTGGDIKSVVRRTTEIMSEKIMISSEIETAITSNKMQMNIMNVLPIVIVLMMRVMSQEFANSFGTIIGVVGMTATVALTAGAYKMGQKIMDIKG